MGCARGPSYTMSQTAQHKQLLPAGQQPSLRLSGTGTASAESTLSPSSAPDEHSDTHVIWVDAPHEGRSIELLNSAVIRAVDIAVSVVLLLLLLPVIVVAALVVRLDSPGPAFYRAPRVGFRGRRMEMLKFRKMHDTAGGPPLTAADDERFTRVGRLYARLKLDEIPQLWNVLLGQMSLVGPRPETAEFVKLHAEAFTDVLSVRPGITGLSQLAFAEESRILDHENPHVHYLDRILPQKIALDQMYAANRSLRLNLKILSWTVSPVFLRQPVAVHRGTGRMTRRRR